MKEKSVEKKMEKGAVRLFFVRHGQTEYNVAGLVQGWCDSPLTEEGILQAGRAGAGLSHVSFDTAYSSDLKRAVNTASMILAANKGKSKPTLKTLSELREKSFGNYERTPVEELFAAIHREMGMYVERNGTPWPAFNGAVEEARLADAIAAMDQTGQSETYAKITKRLFSALSRIVEETRGGQNALVVTHGGVISVLLAEFAKIPYQRNTRNCSLTLIKAGQSGFEVEFSNNTEYMEERAAETAELGVLPGLNF